MPYHETVNKILTLLKENTAWHETFEHEAVRTSEDAAKLRHGYTLHQGAKAMIVRVKVLGGEKKFVMCVLPGDARFDNNKIKQIFNAKDIRLATVEEVSQITDGIEPGGVPPFGNLFGLEVVTDPSVLENEKIIFNAGDRSFSVAMYAKDYQRVVQPKVSNFTI